MTRMDTTTGHEVIAEYEGTCNGCDGDIVPGVTEIFRGDDGWECAECRADSEGDSTRFAQPVVLRDDNDRVEKPARDKATGKPHKDLRGDRWGRYTLIAPNGKPVVVSRASTVIKALADTYNLNRWKQSCVLRGAAVRADLAALAISLNPDNPWDKKKLHDLVEEAETAGGSKSSANIGTAVHGFCEKVDTDPGFLLSDIPRAYRDDVIAYIAALYKADIGSLPDRVERTTMTSGWDGVGGTFDRIYRLSDGRYVIGDLKTGRVGYDPAEMYAQFAVYQDGVQENGVYDRQDADGNWPGTWTRPDFDVDRDVALIVHLPAGKGVCTLYEADLGLGRLHLDRCARIRAERREKHALRPYKAVREEHPEGHEATWAHALSIAPTVDEVVITGRIISACGVMTDDLKALGKERVKSLTDLS